jgi:hypothetical protein
VDSRAALPGRQPQPQETLPDCTGQRLHGVAKSKMPWYRVGLSTTEVAAEKYAKLQTTFDILFKASSSPEDAAMFESNNPKYIYYFSPGAVAIAMPLISAYSGVECSAPSEANVTLLIGHDTKRSIPFAGR